MKLNKKIAVVSHIFPPSYSGQAVMLYKLLENIPPKDYILISSRPYKETGQEKAGKKLPAKYYFLSEAEQFSFLQKLGRFKIFKIFSKIPRIRRRAKEIYEICKKENCSVIIGCTGEIYDIPAAALAAKRMKIPFIPYIFDDYIYQWTGILRKAAAFFEPKAIKQSTAVIVPNEFTQKEYFSRYGKKTVIVRNPVTLPDLKKLDKTENPFDPKFVNIVYSGAIYRAHYDAFSNLINAIKMSDKKIKLHLFTAQTEKELKQNNIWSEDIVLHKHIEQKKVPAVLRKADILFLPLAFNSPIPEVINTSAPGKMGEYMSVERPILTHAPKESFVVDYLKKNKCAAVCDENNPENLKYILNKLIENKELQLEISEKARLYAEKDFEITKQISAFTSFINNTGNKKNNTENGKILLLTDTPPSKKYSGSLLTYHTLKYLPQEDVVCYTVKNKNIQTDIDEHFKNTHIIYREKPKEYVSLSIQMLELAEKAKRIKTKNRILKFLAAVFIFKAKIFSNLVSFFYELYVGLFKISKLEKDLLQFINENRIDKIWCILQGQTILRLARRLQKKTTLPIHTQVWDPFEWNIKSNKIDKLTARRFMKMYDEVIKNSTVCGCASWAMAENYKKKYTLETFPIISGIDKNWKKPPKLPTLQKDKFIIAMAGQLYAMEEFNFLLETLDEMNWQIENKKIILKYIGKNISFYSDKPRNIEFLGYREQRDAINILSECDLLYCPYWFDEHYSQEAKESFPSKLTTYIAAGRLVLFHGPKYASPAKFLKENNAAVLFNSFDRAVFKGTLSDISVHPENYSEILKNADEAFEKYLTFDYMKEQFLGFINEEGQ